MGYFILWMSSMAAALLLAVLGAVCGVRLRDRWQAVVSMCVAALPGFAIGVLATVLSGWLMSHGIRHHWFGYTLSWLVLFTTGATLLGLWALGGAVEDSAPRARSWPAGRIAIGLGAALVLYGAMLFHMDSAVRVQLTKLHAEAMEMMRATIPARVPEGQKAGAVYDQAFEAMGDNESWREIEWLRRVDDPAFDVTTKEVEDLLRRKRPALVLLRRASSMAGYYFEADHTRGPLMRIPSLMSWRNAASLLALSARHKVAKGDMAGALEDLATIRRAADHLSTVPTLIALMIAVAIDDVASSAVENVAAAGGVRSAGPGRLPLQLPASPFHSSLVRAWQVEEASFLTLFVGSEDMMALYTNRNSGWAAGDFSQAVGRVFLLHDEIAVYREWMDKYRSVVRLPFARMNEKARELETDLESGPGGIVAAIALPSMSKCCVSVATGEAKRRLSALALAAEAYRERQGSYPGELAALVPDYIEMVPMDPFSGEPLRMVAVDGGLVLYSVYADGEDDGGKDTWMETDEELDLVFCLGSAYEQRRLTPAREAEEKRRATKGKKRR